MSLRRTESGLTNSHLFVDADVVVYLEGGSSFSKEQVKSDLFSDFSADIRFWQAIFGIYRPSLKFKFKSVGSKEVVRSIAEDISTGRVHNVIAAMDRDFDHINGRMLEIDNVIYTHGYSWENDAWNKNALLEAVCVLSGTCRSALGDEVQLIEDYYRDLFIGLKGAIRIDAVLSQYKKSLFNRSSYFRYVEIQRDGMPNIDKGQISGALKEARSESTGPITRHSEIDSISLADCFGHLFAEYTYRLLSYILVKVKKLPKIPKEYAISTIVDKFSNFLQTNNLTDTYKHYESEFSRVSP